MGAGKSKHESDRYSSESNRGRSFHEALVRERDRKHSFTDIYEVMGDRIGMGGLCEIYKIQKKDDKIGGSSRPEHVRRSSFSKLILRNSPGAKTARKHYLEAAQLERKPSSGHPMFFALKVINLALVREDKIDQLKNEVEILKTLDHKNIIKAYETFQMKTAKKLMIVMELCTGGDLFARLPYSESQAAQIVKQILGAISYMHDNWIVHRDLKFENIMFESQHPEAAIKVIDFGLSKAYSPSDNILTERVGTLYSMSPETMQGTYTYSADLWSIGVCTYMMLAGGQKPFESKTPKQLVAKVLLGQYSFEGEIWKEINEKAKSFIRELLVVKPQDRASASQAMSHPWLSEASLHSTHHSVDEDFKLRVKESIIRYADTGDFRKLALNVIAKKSTSEEIFELRKVFDEFDTLNTGTLTMEEFQEALKQFDYTPEDIAKIFHKIDVNKNSVINYTEFLAAALETQGMIEEYRLAEAFDLMDSDDSGYISRDNLRQILGSHRYG